MSNETNNIGSTIAELRKQKNITQDDLAKAVGVSGQAVSKWENGGSLDISLLPVIADYFGVSIDRLFRRQVRYEVGIQKEIGAQIEAAVEEGKGMLKAFDYIWMIQKVYQGILFKRNHPMFNEMVDNRENMTIDDLWNNGKGICRSIVEADDGVSFMSLDSSLRYFFAMPEPEEGCGKHLYYKEDYTRLFTLLSDPNALKALFLLYGRKKDRAFTPRLLEKELGLTSEQAENLLDKLMVLFPIRKREIEGDSELRAAYTFNGKIEFLPLMIFVDEFLNTSKSTYTQCGGRSIPFIGREES